MPPYGERRWEEGVGVPGEGADWAKDERGLHWGRAGRWGGARKETGDLEFILKATGSLMGWRENKRGHYKDPSVSSGIGIGGPLWKWEEQLGRGPNPGGDAAALNGRRTSVSALSPDPGACILVVISGTQKLYCSGKLRLPVVTLTASRGWERW